MLKRVAFVIDSLGGGGAQKIVLRVAGELCKRGVETHVICTKDKVSYRVPEGVHYHLLAKTRKITPFNLVNKLILAGRFRSLVGRLERESKLDLVISHMRSADRIVKLSGVPGVIYSIRNNLSSQLREWKGDELPRYKAQTRKLYGGGDLIAISRGVAEDITEKLNIPVSSIRTIYNPFDFEAIRIRAAERVYGLEEHMPYVVHVGSFKQQKRHDVLLEAYAKSGIPHKLLLVGEPTAEQREEVSRHATELGISNSVVFYGWSDNPYAMIKNAELFIFSSDFEGLGNVLIESLIVGTRVVSTDCPSGPSEILIGPLAECLSPVGDVDALARNIRRNVGKPLGDVGFALDRFRLADIVDKFFELPLRTGGGKEAADISWQKI